VRHILFSSNSTVGRASFTGARIYFQEGSPMSLGTVKWFNAQKGFGFIAPDNGGADAFVHISAMERAGISDLQEGQKVAYELVADRKSGKMTADQLQIQT
jgi:CspA family cold shock protein